MHDEHTEPPPDPVAEAVDYRRAGFTALILLVLLNVADVVITELAISRGGSELNPVANTLLSSNLAIVVKLAIIVLLGIDFAMRRPRLITLCALWLVVGVYVVVVILNGVELVSLS
jgi:hypothetical protein